MKREQLLQNEVIRLSIYLKINQLRREQLNSLTYSHIISVLFYDVWNRKLPNSIHQAVNDIMKLEAKVVVTSLHTIAMIEGSKLGLTQIQDILGGN